MSVPNRNRVQPLLEGLESRGLMAGGVTANLWQGVLSVVGTSADDPIVLQMNVARFRNGVRGTVVVEDLAAFDARQVRRVVIRAVANEPVVVNRLGTWNPPVKVIVPPSRPLPPPKPVKPPVVTPPPVTNPPPIDTLTPAAQAIVDLVNQQRARFGLAALRVNPKLVQAAQIHAADMARLRTMAHDLPGTAQPGLVDRAEFVGYNFSTLGENIAEGYPDASSVMNGWMNSPGHRSNILGGGYTEIGVGIATSANGVPYYCQVFGRSQGA